MLTTGKIARASTFRYRIVMGINGISARTREVMTDNISSNIYEVCQRFALWLNNRTASSAARAASVISIIRAVSRQEACDHRMSLFLTR
ncbi:hypothetical protein NDU88_002954 [Pleurodeles waltl]|uniref:Uncharacterized protein n=1 Tax=Pleurodeles waltl TaxID=8319 RepID=A0AAV7KXL4_PLEWA|nr:hypothetical protein NDU88_002954 [Pleurodeles waltl]